MVTVFAAKHSDISHIVTRGSLSAAFVTSPQVRNRYYAQIFAHWTWSRVLHSTTTQITVHALQDASAEATFLETYQEDEGEQQGKERQLYGFVDDDDPGIMWPGHVDLRVVHGKSQSVYHNPS